MICDARIRPLPDDTEIVCESTAPHERDHAGMLRDYAGPGSETLITWDEHDRRTFHGEWPGKCVGDIHTSCVLPTGHRGNHAP